VVTENASPALAPSNRQAQTAVVDYIGVTFKGESLEDVVKLFDGSSSGWESVGHGWKGYAAGLRKGSIAIWYGGDREQGVNVQVSGQGCRELEGANVLTDWRVFLGSLLELGCFFSRLDVAMDDRAGLLQKQAIEAAIDSGRVVSRYKSVHEHRSRSLSEAKEEGWTRYFGANSSETKIRIYDKCLERLAKGQEADGHWMRVELQARREKAQELARVVVQFGMSGVASVIRGLLEFKEQGTHSQRERWDCCAWWSDFLEGVGKVRLSLAPVVRTIEKVRAWLWSAVAPLAAVVHAYDGDSMAFFQEMMVAGKERWRPRHKHLLGAT
jgi:DNA relaxase NicK